MQIWDVLYVVLGLFIGGVMGLGAFYFLRFMKERERFPLKEKPITSDDKRISELESVMEKKILELEERLKRLEEKV